MVSLMDATSAQLVMIAAQIPDVVWVHDDDLCDCTFQRIGDWTNPYIGRTLRVRFCCIWEEIYKQFPEFVQQIPAFNDYREGPGRFELLPREWDSHDHAMPRAIWYRQLQTLTGRSLAEIRVEYADQEPPQAKPLIWLR